MANNTKINWVTSKGKAERTWNPMQGCTRISAGCKNCYALNMINRFAGMKGWPDDSSGKVTLYQNRLADPYRWKKESVVFVCSMGDLFHGDVSWHFIDQVYASMLDNKQHTFIILTKRSQNMVDFLLDDTLRLSDIGRAGNIWHGVSIENNRHLERIDHLRTIPGINTFVSFEPLIEDGRMNVDLEGIELAIIGGESGSDARPFNLAPVADIIENADKSGAKVFVKQMGTLWASERGMGRSKGDIMDEWPEWLQRRELPW